MLIRYWKLSYTWTRKQWNTLDKESSLKIFKHCCFFQIVFCLHQIYDPHSQSICLIIIYSFLCGVFSCKMYTKFEQETRWLIYLFYSLPYILQVRGCVWGSSWLGWSCSSSSPLSSRGLPSLLPLEWSSAWRASLGSLTLQVLSRCVPWIANPLYSNKHQRQPREKFYVLLRT